MSPWFFKHCLIHRGREFTLLLGLMSATRFGFNKMMQPRIHPGRCWKYLERCIFHGMGRRISRYGDMNWPARSPDLNGISIFFFLGNYLKRQVYDTLWGSNRHLNQCIQVVLEEIPKKAHPVVICACFVDCPVHLEELMEFMSNEISCIDCLYMSLSNIFEIRS